MRARHTIPWLALGLLACTQKKAPADADAAAAEAQRTPRVVVRRVRLQDKTPAELRPVALDPDALAGALKGALTAVGLPLADDAERDAWRVGVTAQVVYGVDEAGQGMAREIQPGTAKVHWQIELRIRPPGMSEAMYTYVTGAAEGPFAGDSEAALRALLEDRALAALEPVARKVATRLEALRQDTPTLIAQLEHADPDVRHASAARLGMLRATEAVPALAARIPKEKDRDVLLRMVGALAEIGDDRAAGALIGLADPRDRELLRAVVDALSVVGGKRVDDFLDILAMHDAADVREMVKQARARLRDRGAEGP